MSQDAPQQPATKVVTAPASKRVIKQGGLPMRWIIAAVVSFHIGLFALLSVKSEQIMGAVHKKEPQNFYHAEEVYEVEAADGEGLELMRVREFTVSTKLWQDDDPQTLQPDIGPQLETAPPPSLPEAPPFQRPDQPGDIQPATDR